jgi:hypothetical protein
MAETPSPAMWAELRGSASPTGEQLAVRPLMDGDGETGLALAIDATGDLHMLVPVPAGAPPLEVTDLTGLRVRRRVVAGQEHIDLVATPAHEHVFTPVCGEVLEAVHVRRRAPAAAVTSILRAWQAAWRPARAAMDKSTQVGLFGELFILWRLMLPAIGPIAVDQWSGPDYERHDFVGQRLHLEVKTTRKGRPEHEISRLDQLRVPAGRTLLVASVLLEESAAGELTVANLVDRIVDAVRAEPGVAYRFLSKAAAVGWSDEMRTSGELLRFFLRDAAAYSVDDRFPRLPDDFRSPSGVLGVRYTISLANILPLAPEVAEELIREANERQPA